MKKPLSIHAVPRNAGHMNAVYDAVCPLIAGWVRDILGVDGGVANGWHLTGAGMSLSCPKVNESSPAVISAASISGGKSVNQDACGWRMITKPGGGGVRVVAVADGVSGSLYSEFGAMLATVAALRAGASWAESGGGLEGIYIHGLAECRSQMGRVVERIRSELERTVETNSSQMGAQGVEEARRQLDIFNQDGAEPLCTTALVLVACGNHVEGMSIGNGGIYRCGGATLEPLWWQVDSDDLREYVGVGTTPQRASYSFEDTWKGEAGAVGLATDGVGSFERFKQVYLRRASWPSGKLLLEDVLSDMSRRGVSLDLIDNLTVAEVGMAATDNGGSSAYGA